MNALSKAPLTGEVLSARDLVRVIAAHPIRGKVADIRRPAGATLRELIDEARAVASIDAVSSGLFSRLVVSVTSDTASTPVPEDWWDRVRPRAGTVVTVTPALGNLKSILGLAIAVAALVVAPYLAPGLVSLAAGAGLTLSAATAGSLIAAGIVVAGTLALTALFPTRPSTSLTSSDSFTQLNSIAGAQNQANPFGSIPVVLGFHRQSPYFGALEFTENVGDDQYLRVLFCPGYGPLDLSDFRIGDTALDQFADVQTEVRQGFADDAPISLFPSEVFEDQLSITLDKDGGAWSLRTTHPDIDQFSVDFTAPEGIFQVDQQSGAFGPYTVTVFTQYRPTGGVGSWVDAPSLTFTRATTTKRLGFLVTLPSRGQYDVQTRRSVTAVNAEEIANRTKEAVDWTALRSIRNDHPIAFPKPLALIALRIKATDQLNGTVNTFSCLCKSLVKAYDGTAWNDNTASRNPADLYRWVLQSAANAQPVGDDLIDLGNLADWWSYCHTQGFAFNIVKNQTGSVYDQLADIAAAGRAVPTFIDGKYAVVWDRPDDPYVDIYSPRNSWGFSGTHPYAKLPHGWRVQFINEANGYTTDERIVYDDGYDATNATLFEQLEFPGVTDPDLIWRHGRFQIAQARLRPEEITLSVGWQGLVATRGDRVRVTHDVLLIGQVSGRVKTIAGQVITIDEGVTIEAEKTYAVMFRNADATNRTVQRAVDASVLPGEYAAGSNITLVGDLTVIDSNALFGFGETDQETAVYRVKSITNQKDLIAQLVLVDDAPAISLADQGTVPAYVPNVTLPVDPLSLAPGQLAYQEKLDASGPAVRVLVHLTWQLTRQGRAQGFEAQFRDDDISGDWQPAGTVAYPVTSIDAPITSAGIWSFRVRTLFATGQPSGWATLDRINLLGLTSPLPPVTGFRSKFVDGVLNVSFDEVTDFRPGIRYEIRRGDTAETAPTLGTIAHPPFPAPGDGKYWFAAVLYVSRDLTVYSSTWSSFEVSGSSLVGNVVAEFDFQALGFPGPASSFSGLARSGTTPNIYLRTGGSGDIRSADPIQDVPIVQDDGGETGGNYHPPSSYVIDIGRVAACPVTTSIKALGAPVGEDIRIADPFQDVQDVAGSASTRFVDAYWEVRTATTQDGDLDQVGDLDEAGDLDQAGIAWTAWQKAEPGSYYFRWIDFRLTCNTADPAVEGQVHVASVRVDVPDRVDTYTNIVVPHDGLTITFRPTGASVDAPFNFGPGGPGLPLHYQFTGSGDVSIVVDAISYASITFHLIDGSGNPIAGTGNLFVQGA